MRYDQFKSRCIENLIKHYQPLERGGSFNGRGAYAHILKCKEDVRSLLLFRTNECYVEKGYLVLSPTCGFSPRRGIKLHRCAHHLNSSQIFCINLFYPLMQNPKCFSMLLADFGVRLRGDIALMEFEYTPDGFQHTNFDFFAETKIGERVFCEFKYTECGFGRPSESSMKEWDRPIGFSYKKQIEKSIFAKQLGLKETFFANYQINRNLAYVKGENDYVIFLYPHENESLTLPRYAEFHRQVAKIDTKKMINMLIKNDELGAYYQLVRDVYFGDEGI